MIKWLQLLEICFVEDGAVSHFHDHACDRTIMGSAIIKVRIYGGSKCIWFIFVAVEWRVFVYVVKNEA